MTSFVTREEYDSLAARLAALENKQAARDEKIADLVRDGISQGWQEFERSLGESQRRGYFGRFA